MSWRAVTLSGWAAIAAAALACELLGALGPDGFPTVGDIIDWLMRARAGRWVVIGGWLWLGWHTLVR